MSSLFFFFFQAEDGIRDYKVTGVQTCALPIYIDRPWDAYADDQLGLMDHLGIREFMVMGFCIGGPMIYNLIRRASEGGVAAAMMQPTGFRAEIPGLFYQNKNKGWGPPPFEKRPHATLDMVPVLLPRM